MVAQHQLIRRREVRRLSGWSNKYISKLVVTGVLRVWRPKGEANARAWFYRCEVENLLADQNQKP